MRNQYRLDIRSDGAASRPRQQVYDAEARVEVRELTTRVAIRIPARDVSPYRHRLLLGGEEFQILNVVQL